MCDIKNLYLWDSSTWVTVVTQFSNIYRHRNTSDYLYYIQPFSYCTACSTWTNYRKYFCCCSSCCFCPTTSIQHTISDHSWPHREWFSLSFHQILRRVVSLHFISCDWKYVHNIVLEYIFQIYIHWLEQIFVGNINSKVIITFVNT